MVAQFLTSQTQRVKTQLRWRGKALGITLPPLSIATCLWKPPDQNDVTP